MSRFGNIWRLLSNILSQGQKRSSETEDKAKENQLEVQRLSIDHLPPDTSQADFQSLVNRSIAAWQSINYVGQSEDRTSHINRHTRLLQSYSTLEQVLESNIQYWFFQLREPFLRQKEFRKWDPAHLDEYVLLPIDYGFVNNQDCFFISHYWRTREHPDPQAIDLIQGQNDLRDEAWSYIWVDWTCMPQAPRSEVQKRYFSSMLRCISMLVRDCAFHWRFPAFEPRAWILAELAEYVLNHYHFIRTEDNEQFILHIHEMIPDGVWPVIKRYGYRCTSESDMNVVVGWLEITILLAKLFPDDVGVRQVLLDDLNRPAIGTFANLPLGLEVDKTAGTITYKGVTHKFTPLFRIAS